MAVAKKCDRCGKFYEGTRDNTYKIVETDEDGMTRDLYINSLRIGNWSTKRKSWISIASAYDLCYECGKEIADVIFDSGELKMRMVKRDRPVKETVAAENAQQDIAEENQEQEEAGDEDNE